MTEKVADSSVLYDSSPRTHNQNASPSEAGQGGQRATRLVRGHAGGLLAGPGAAARRPGP